MEKQFCFNYEHYAALAGLSDADRRLVAEAQRATENAHAPYSHFRVGAAARLRSGKILYGSNFESEVYPRRWPSLRIPPRASATPAASVGR